jgi:hypothetical protein
LQLLLIGTLQAQVPPPPSSLPSAAASLPPPQAAVPQRLHLLLDPVGPAWGAERLAHLQQPSASLQPRAVHPAHRLAGLAQAWQV